jgi:hypothetical protein
MIWSSPILQEVHPFLSASLNLHSQVYTSGGHPAHWRQEDRRFSLVRKVCTVG